MQPGDHVIWLRSAGRSFLTGWKVTHLPTIVLRVCPRRIKIRVFVDAQGKALNVDPDNSIHPREMESDKKTMKQGKTDIQLLTFQMLGILTLWTLRQSIGCPAIRNRCQNNQIRGYNLVIECCWPGVTAPQVTHEGATGLRLCDPAEQGNVHLAWSLTPARTIRAALTNFKKGAPSFTMKKKSNLSVTATGQRRRSEAKLGKQRKNQRAKVPVGRRAVADTDITARKQAEEALARERDLLQSVLNSAGKAHLAYLDRDFNFVRVNETLAATCGYRPEEMIGKNHFALYPDAENEAIFRRVRDTGKPFEIRDKLFEFPGQPERGMSYWDWTLIPVKDAVGHVTGLILSSFETTVRVRGEEALQRANDELTRRSREALAERQRFFDMVEILPVMVCLMTPDYHVTFANRAFREKFGESNGRHCYEYCCGFCESFVPLKTGQPHHWTFTSPDGSTFIDAYDFPFTDVDGSPAILEVDIDITERRQAEEALRRLAQFPAENPGPVLRVAGNSALLYANEPARSWLATLGWHANDPLPDAVLTIVTAAREQNQVIRREITSPDGRTLWLSTSQLPAEDYVNLYGNDITERKLAQEALQASEERLDLAFRGAQDGVWDWNIETDEVFYSTRWKTMLGYEESEIEPHASAWKRLLHPDDLPMAMQVVNDVLHGEKDYVMEFRMRHKDGHYVDVLSRGFPIRRGPNGPIVRIVGTHFDLTERKRAEEALRESQRHLREAQRIARIGNWEWNLRTGETHWSPEIYTMHGLSPDAPTFTPEALLKHVHPDDRDLVSAVISKAVSEGTQADLDYRTVRPDGSIRVIHAVGAVTEFDAAGRPLIMVGTNQDITERKLAEEKLRQLSLVVEQNPVSVVITDLRGNILYVNRKFTEVSGYSLAECLGQNPRILKSGDSSPETYRELWTTITNGEMWSGPLHNRKKNGELYWEWAVILPLVDETGKITHFVGIKEDITKRREAELEAQRNREEIAHLSRVAMLGQLSGSLAHELNQPLAAILSNAQAA